MATRRLPTVVGATENALRSLLARVLADTKINGYAEWVFLNLRSAASEVAQLDEQVADVLMQPLPDVHVARQRLEAGGLIDPTGALTQFGLEELRRGRELVGAATEKLINGIATERLEAVAEVLDTVRRRAEKELS